MMGRRHWSCEQPHPPLRKKPSHSRAGLGSENERGKEENDGIVIPDSKFLWSNRLQNLFGCCLCAQTKSDSLSTVNKRFLPIDEVLGTDIQSFFENLISEQSSVMQQILRGQGSLNRKGMGGGAVTTRTTPSCDTVSEDKQCPREENSSNTGQSFATVVNLEHFGFILFLSFLWLWEAYESFESL